MVEKCKSTIKEKSCRRHFISSAIFLRPFLETRKKISEIKFEGETKCRWNGWTLRLLRLYRSWERKPTIAALPGVAFLIWSGFQWMSFFKLERKLAPNYNRSSCHEIFCQGPIWGQIQFIFRSFLRSKLIETSWKGRGGGGRIWSLFPESTFSQLTFECFRWHQMPLMLWVADNGGTKTLSILGGPNSSKEAF